MNKKQQIAQKKQLNHEVESEPFLRWKFKFNEKTGEDEFDSITLSDDSVLNKKKFKAAVKKATGTSDLNAISPSRVKRILKIYIHKR